MSKYWKLRNEELGCMDSTRYETFEDAWKESCNKCRRHGVAEFDAETDEEIRYYSSSELFFIQ